MFNMWVDYKEGGIVTLNNLRAIYGAPAYAYDDHVALRGKCFDNHIITMECDARNSVDYFS